MAKRSNNSLSRRSYGAKPYDANNSFVKKMATKVTDLIPQRSWISKWFNPSQDNGDVSNEAGNSEEVDTEEEEISQQPPAKRPRIRMDITHPPGTFTIRARNKQSSNRNDSRGDARFLRENESEEYFLEPAIAGPSGVCKFVSSTPAIHAEPRKSNVQSAQQQQQQQPIGSLIAMGNNGASNGADDNSESGESTSGCSSLIPQTNRQEGAGNSAYGSSLADSRRFMNDKSSFANYLQSPRCLFLENGNRESFNSRRPSFNASMMMSNNSNNTLNRASSLSSPFYSGNVTFGGSNALGHIKRSRSLFNSNNEFQLKIPRRTSVQVKPSNAECLMDASGMSQTAKRILEAMEYFSSPIADAKKIPVKNYSTVGKKRTRDEQQDGLTGSPSLLPTARVGLRHLTRELAVPTVPDMLKLRRRKKLQDTTVAARKIISAMAGGAVVFDGPSVTASHQSREPTRMGNEDYHLRTELDQSPKYHGKLRGKSKKNPKEEGPAPPVNLPSISLAITSLPSFEPLPKYTVPASNENDRRGFKFASPIKITEAAWNLKSINNFSFSQPINARVDEPDTTKILGTKSSNDLTATNFMWSGSSTAPRLKVKTKKGKDEKSENVECPSGPLFGSPAMKEMAKLKSENVGDVEKSESSSQKINFGGRTLNSEIWECTECYIKNDSKENVCVACKATKPRKTTIDDEVSSRVPIASNVNESTSFGSQYKMNVNQWECESCLVRNKQTSLRCVSCSTTKPITTIVPPLNEPLVSMSKISKEKSSSDLMDKFKAPEGSWECPGCMLRNPSAVITCPCCNAAKPSLRNISPKKTNLDKNTNDGETGKKTIENSSIMDKFKPATSSWECSSCMVRNNESASSCVCCANPKAGTATISGETPKSTISTTGWADKFKKSEGSWSCDSCMVQNKSEVTECIVCEALKPGATPKPRSSTATSNFSVGITTAQNTPTFNFGIDKAGEKIKTDTSLVSTNGFSFGGKNPQNDANFSQFTFGMPKKTVEQSETTSKVSKNPTGFVFAPPKNSKVSNESERVESTVGHNEKKIESFSFGQSNALSEKKTLEEKTAIFGGDAGGKFAKAPFVVVFGAPKSDDDRAETNKSKIILDETTSESPKTTVFGGQSMKIPITNIANPINEGVEFGKSIGASSEEEKGTSSNLGQARSPFTFSEPKSKLTSSSISSSFGSTPVTPATSALIFGIPETENKLSAAQNFGAGSATFGGSFGQSSSPSPILSEASTLDAKQQKTCPAFPSAEKKSIIFGLPGEKKHQPEFGATIEKKTLFGNPDKSTAVFGTNDKPITTTNSNSIFNAPISIPASSSGFPGASSSGTSQQPVFGSSTTPVFGGNNTSSFTAGSMNIFATGGKSIVPSTPTSNLFTFAGASTQQVATPAAQPPSGGFSFVTTDSGAESTGPVAKAIFAFGTGTGSQQSECFGGAGASLASGVAFGTPAPTNPVSSPFGTFNASGSKQDPPAPPPPFGQATAAAPTIPSMFGAQQPLTTNIGQQPTTGGFNFGATVPAPISGAFNFGGGMAQQPATATSGGFNFNAVAPSPSIAFDPNTRPSFNFTGGSAPTAFNATPQPATTRKIKKAVRRMQQR